MSTRALASIALAFALLLGAGCRRTVVRTVPAPSPSVITAPQPAMQAQASFQLLYIPPSAAAMLPLHLIARVMIQTSDGQYFELGPGDIQQMSTGYVAVRIPLGVTTGTATVQLHDGRTWSTTFHIAVSSSGQIVGTMEGAMTSDARCTQLTGTWQGTITSDPNSRATVWLEVLGDCRSVRGFVHLDSPSAGSVDSTIEGTWDYSSGVLTARDTQLFNVQPLPGGSFCATDQYQIQLQPDGYTLAGRNITYSGQCRSDSPVWLRRTQ